MRASDWLVYVVLLSTAACVVPHKSGARPVDRDRVLAKDFADRDFTNAYEVVECLRPNWLTSRGPTSVRDPRPQYADVFVDGISTGSGPEYLTQIHISQVLEIRFYRPSEAGARYGMNHPRGVIDVITVEVPSSEDPTTSGPSNGQPLPSTDGSRCSV